MGMSGIAVRNKGRRGRRRVPRYRAMAEINMTPFIDIILVLLIIFMWPRRCSRRACNRPCPTKAAALNIEQKPISVAVDDKGLVYVMDQPIQIADFRTS